MAYYKDIREYIKALEERELLWRIKTAVKKETELSPMVRWQFRGLTEDQRRAFLFENVIDSKGHKYDVPVLVGALAGSKKIYATGLQCKPEEIQKKWDQAQHKPIPPKLVKDGPVHEVIMMGKELKEEGLDRFPFAVDIPGFEGILRTTSSHFFSKDPETGVGNIGCYSSYVIARDRMAIGIGPVMHMRTNWQKAKEMGLPFLPAALVPSMVPAVCYTSVARIPYGTDELEISGGLAGEPIEMVKCKTVDIEVPATAEIVIEGKVSTSMEMNNTGAFGEYTGYMAEPIPCLIFDITCITHRRNPILMNIISQMPPSESSKIRQLAYEGVWYNFLKRDCGINSVLDVAFHEISGSCYYCVIQMKKRHPAEAWQALNAAVAHASFVGKFFITVDEDIDPRDPESVNWALCFRTQPHLDTRITMGKTASLDPSAAPPTAPWSEKNYPSPRGCSALLIDATRKWDYPSVSLPKREYMERARELWEAEGLPALKPRVPWFGYKLGHWPKEYEEAAESVIKGEIYQLGERVYQQRRQI